MCGGCPFCGQTTYGYIGHASREQCVNALKGALRSAQEGREMVRETLTAERDRYREALGEIAAQDPVENALDPQWAARIAAAALDDTQTGGNR